MEAAMDELDGMIRLTLSMISCDMLSNRNDARSMQVGGALSHAPHAGTNAKPLVIVRADCAYADSMFMRAFSRRTNSWSLSHKSMDSNHACIQIDEYEAIDWSRVLSPPFMVASSYCMRKGLGRKANMAASLELHSKKCKAVGGCPLRTALPETVPIDTTGVYISRPARVDFHSAMAEAMFEAEDAMARCTNTPDSEICESGARIDIQYPCPWILKPSITNKGAGIELVLSIEDVARAVRELPEVGQWVLQRYIPRPLALLGSRPTEQNPHAARRLGHKFHIRMYVLAVGALTVYVYHEALLLIAVHPYVESDFSIRTSHITNTCVGTAEEGFREETHVRALVELPQLLVDAGRCTTLSEASALRDRVYTDSRAIIAHAFCAQEASAGGYMPLPRCFELYGVDLLVDEDAHTWLLEFNPSPDIAQTGGRLGSIIASMTDGVFAIAVDRRVTVLSANTDAEQAQDDALRIEVDVEPAQPHPGSGMVVASDGCVAPAADPTTNARGVVCPELVPLRVDPSGWDMVYTKKWNQAHGAGRMTIS